MITAIFLDFLILLLFNSFVALYQINLLVVVPFLPRFLSKSNKTDIRDVRSTDILKRGPVICTREQRTRFPCLLQIPICLLTRARSDEHYKYYAA